MDRVAGTRPPPPTLDDPAGDEDRQLRGEGRDARADDEDRQATEQHALAIDEVGQPADQRQDRDITQEEAADDGRRTLEVLDAEPDACIMSVSASTTT